MTLISGLMTDNTIRLLPYLWILMVTFGDVGDFRQTELVE